MALKHRVARLERGAGARPCRCPLEQFVVVRPGEPVPPPPPRRPDGSCPACGGRVPDLLPRIIVRLPPDGPAVPEGEERWA